MNCAPFGDIQLTITYDRFLETLLLRLRGETLKYASIRKKTKWKKKKKPQV